jgi:hypothetical protein
VLASGLTQRIGSQDSCDNCLWTRSRSKTDMPVLYSDIVCVYKINIISVMPTMQTSYPDFHICILF